MNFNNHFFNIPIKTLFAQHSIYTRYTFVYSLVQEKIDIHISGFFAKGNDIFVFTHFLQYLYCIFVTSGAFCYEVVVDMQNYDDARRSPRFCLQSLLEIGFYFSNTLLLWCQQNSRRDLLLLLVLLISEVLKRGRRRGRDRVTYMYICL